MKIVRAEHILGWAVSVDELLGPQMGQTFRRAGTIGIVYDKGTMSVWAPAGYSPRWYTRSARAKLAEAAEKLVQEGKIRWTKTLGNVLARYGLRSGLYGPPGAKPVVSRARKGYFRPKDLVYRVLNASGRWLGEFPKEHEAVVFGIKWSAEYQAPSFVQKYDKTKKVALEDPRPARMGGP